MPAKPPQHWQVKPPGVLMQVALAAQSDVPRTHSLMSMLHCGPSYLLSADILWMVWELVLLPGWGEGCSMGRGCMRGTTAAPQQEGSAAHPVPSRPRTRVELQSLTATVGASLGLQGAGAGVDSASRKRASLCTILSGPCTRLLQHARRSKPL